MVHNPNLVNFLYIMYGIAIGIPFAWGLSKKICAKRTRDRLYKIAETHTLAIADFTGKSVSLERFCDKLFGPEALYANNSEMRKREIRNWILLILMCAVIVIVPMVIVKFH